MYMYPQRASIPIQGIDRHALTVGAISGPNCHIGAPLWCHFTSCGFTWLAKNTLKKHYHFVPAWKLTFSITLNLWALPLVLYSNNVILLILVIKTTICIIVHECIKDYHAPVLQIICNVFTNICN